MQTRNLLDITVDKAKEYFSNENWLKKTENIFQAESRKPKNKQQSIIFEKEMKMSLSQK